MVTTVQLADGFGARCRYKRLIVVALGVVLLLDSQMPSGFLVTWRSRCRPDYQKSRGRLSVTELVAVRFAVEPVVGTCRLVSWRARSRPDCHRSRRCHDCCSSAAVLKLVEPVAVLIMAGPPGAFPAALHTSFHLARVSGSCTLPIQSLFLLSAPAIGYAVGWLASHLCSRGLAIVYASAPCIGYAFA